MAKAQTIVWQALSWPSTVVHTHTVSDGNNGHGLAIGKTDGDIPFAMEYNLMLTMDWDVRELFIKSLLDERAIRLVHKGDQWYDGSGQHLMEFDGVELVDISISPFTNTLPIKRLNFEHERSQKVDVIYFDENRFSLLRLQQIYSQIDKRTYRYQDIALPSFVSDIVVDDDGMVLNFSGLFERV